MTDALFDPPPAESAPAHRCGWRDDVLLDIRACEGGWHRVGCYADDSYARHVARMFRRWCVRTKWQAFEFKTHGCTVYGRFVGTRMVPAKNTHRETSTAAIMRRRASRAKPADWT